MARSRWKLRWSLAGRHKHLRKRSRARCKCKDNRNKWENLHLPQIRVPWTKHEDTARRLTFEGGGTDLGVGFRMYLGSEKWV